MAALLMRLTRCDGGAKGELRAGFESEVAAKPYGDEIDDSFTGVHGSGCERGVAAMAKHALGEGDSCGCRCVAGGRYADDARAGEPHGLNRDGRGTPARVPSPTQKWVPMHRLTRP